VDVDAHFGSIGRSPAARMRKLVCKHIADLICKRVLEVGKCACEYVCDVEVVMLSACAQVRPADEVKRHARMVLKS
jgi:hypothetical protein